MELPLINRISDFEGLKNHSFLSPYLFFSGLKQVNGTSFIFWNWGALILALAAIFGTVLLRIKIRIFSFRQNNPLTLQSLLSDDDFDFDSEFDETSSLSSLEADNNDECSSSCSEDWCPIEDDNSVMGDCFSWSDLFNNNSVVKLWDNLGLGLDLNKTPNSISIHDMNKEQNVFSLRDCNCFLPACSTSSAANVILSDGNEDSKKGNLNIWDTRVGCRVPAILTKCRSGKAVDIGFDGVGKIYLTDNSSGELTVSDMRKPKSPLMEIAESEVTQCFDSVRSHPF